MESPNVNTLFESHNSQLNGFYRQIVVQNNDPLLSGRLQVNIYGITDNIDSNNLPWAEPLIGFAGQDYGDIKIPQVGSQVAIIFEQGNIFRPFYFAQIQKNTSNGYLPDYNNYSQNDQGNTFITKYPQKFNPPNQFETIIYETTQQAQININSVYDNDRFTLQVQNNPNHQDHILITYKGNDIVVTETSDSSSADFSILQGIDFQSTSLIEMKQTSSLGGEIVLRTTNTPGIQELSLNSTNSTLIYNTSFLTMTSQHILLGGQISRLYLGTPTNNPSGTNDITLQYQQQLAEVRQILQNLIQAFNTHMHTGNLGQPTTPPLTPDIFTGYQTTLGTTTTRAW